LKEVPVTTINRLSDFITETKFALLPPETTDHVKMHTLDTIGAMLIGAQTIEGVPVGRLVEKFVSQGDTPVIGYRVRTGLLPAIVAQCAAARCTEIDDIHLDSCTTPGSVIVPTALSMVRAGYLRNSHDFMIAVTLGYELLIRMGIAIHGPEVLYRGVWPTYLAAALGSSTVAARALKLTSQDTASALATALTMSTGIAGRVRTDASSRWLTLGVAAQNGVIAAFSAQEGFSGDDAVLDNRFGRVHGLVVSQEELINDIGQRYHINQTGIKPYPTARQALAAVEAVRELVTAHQINPVSIQELIVWVPRQFLTIIDHPHVPKNRRESIISVQYQIALAIFSPKGLFDVKREYVAKDARIITLMDKIRVKPSEELERYYPSVWPARVEIRADRQHYVKEMLHPKGDIHNAFGWEEVISKFRWVATPVISEAVIEKIAHLVRTIDTEAHLTSLLELLT
jgi:2-methylcitrate dehydratase PrpD